MGSSTEPPDRSRDGRRCLWDYDVPPRDSLRWSLVPGLSDKTSDGCDRKEWGRGFPICKGVKRRTVDLEIYRRSCDTPTVFNINLLQVDSLFDNIYQENRRGDRPFGPSSLWSPNIYTSRLQVTPQAPFVENPWDFCDLLNFLFHINQIPSPGSRPRHWPKRVTHRTFIKPFDYRNRPRR